MKIKGAVLLAALMLVALLAACAPKAIPTPTATTPPAAPNRAAEPTKAPAPSPTKPAAPMPTPRPATLKYGSSPSVGDAGVYVGIEKGYFKEQGITLEYVPFSTSPEVQPAVSTGQVDAAGLALGPPLLNALDRGISIKVVADKGNSRPNFNLAYIVLRKDLADSGQVKTAADLKGMKVAVPGLATVAVQAVELMLAEVGLTVKDVEIVPLTFPDMLAAFANKSIAAAYEAEPFTAMGAEQQLFIKWKPISSLFGGQLQSTVIAFSPQLASNQELGRRWMIGFLRGVRHYNKAVETKGDQWDEVVAILSKYTPIKDPKVYKTMEVPYLDPNGALDKRSMDLQYQWIVRQGLYSGSKTFDDSVDLSFAEYAAQRLGKQ